MKTRPNASWLVAVLAMLLGLAWAQYFQLAAARMAAGPLDGTRVSAELAQAISLGFVEIRSRTTASSAKRPTRAAVPARTSDL